MSEFIYYDCLNPIQVELDLRGFPYPVRVGFQRMVKESDYAALRQQLATAHAALREVERETWTGLKVTNDQLRWALKELGPTGTNAEAYIKAAVEYLIDCRAKVQP